MCFRVTGLELFVLAMIFLRERAARCDSWI
jgi:hypothetical protein